MYAKIFSRIAESSLMEEVIEVRYTFMMMIPIADPEGYVVGTDIAIARRLNMPVELFKKCVEKLMEPDHDTNSEDEEGRRVIRSDLERGYKVVNYIKYRDMKDETERRNYMREYMRNRRASEKSVNGGKQKLAQEEEAAEEEVQESVKDIPASAGPGDKKAEGPPEEGNAKESEGGGVSESRKFSDGWIAGIKAKFGFGYIYSKVDGISAARLLKHYSADELLDLAKKAWEKTDKTRFWNCVEMGREVPKFVSKFNAIRTELARDQGPVKGGKF